MYVKNLKKTFILCGTLLDLIGTTHFPKIFNTYFKYLNL